MKKIVVISGSPRKNGNTMSIVKIIEKIIKTLDERIEFKYLHLIDMDLKWCRGCWRIYCLKKGGTSCPLKDDSLAIKKELDSADALIFASPCYGHLPSALFANFTNRFMYLDHLPEYIGTPALIVATTETDGATRVTNYINTMFALPWGCDVTGKLAVNHTFFKTNEKYHEKIMKRINIVSNHFYKTIVDQKTKPPSLMQYLCFLYNRDEAILYKDILTGRYQFWENRKWFKSVYYYDTKIYLHHRVIGYLVLLAMNTYARRGIGKNYKKRLTDYYRTKENPDQVSA